MIEKQIIEVFQKAITAAVEGSTNPVFPVKYIGRTLNNAPSKYLELISIPNNRQGDYWNNARVYQGNFRLILHWDVSDEGAYPAATYIDELAGYFPKGRRLQLGDCVVEIYGDPDASGVIETGSELLFPVALPYRCFRA